ncbi:hypothetical protein [Providencia manganoxydans]
MIGFVLGSVILYLIYFLLNQTLNIISNLFKEQSVKNDLMNEYKEKDKDI